MIRSGEHALWDAHMVRGAALAVVHVRVDLTPIVRALERIATAYGRSVHDCAGALQRCARAYGLALRGVADLPATTPTRRSPK